MAELQEEGSVKHVGVSNFPPSMVEDATRGGGRGGSLVPPSSGSTQVGTTPNLNFRAVFGLDGEVTALEVEP
jgi:hypothetical protein